MASASAIRISQLQQAIREAAAEAQRVAAAQRSVPLPPQAQMPMAARVGIGNRASAAVGDEMPRPQPATEPLRAAPSSMPLAIGDADLNQERLVEAMRKFQTGGPEALDTLEALELVRAGAVPEMLFAGPLTQDQASILLRRIANEGVESLSPEEIAALKRTPATPAEAPPAPEAPVPTDEIAPVAGSAGLDLTETAVSEPDNLVPSGVDLSSERNPNLTPKTAKPNRIESLAQRIRQATTPADGEPVAGLKKLQAEVARLSPESRQALLEHPSLAEGIESAAAKRDPDARNAAIANAQNRLASLEQLAGISTTDRAAEQIVNAADARAVAQQVPATGPRPVMPQGSRTLDVATEDLPDYELPSMFDVAVALGRERAERAARQAPLGGMPEEERRIVSILNRLGTSERPFENAPIALRGRDRAATPFESRSIGSRLTDRNDAKAIEKVRTDGVPNKWAKGRQAWTDSWLNKAGQQETFDGLLTTIIGSRPSRGKLTRTNPDMTPAERQLQEADIVRTFGERDASELLPDSGGEELVELGSDGKRGRLGSTQQPSRVMGAMRQLFGDVNPLTLVADENGALVFGNATEVAEELLSRNTLVKPGTASWDYAVEKLSSAIEDAYTPRAAATTEMKKAEMAAADPAQPGLPAGDVREGTSLDVDALPANQSVWPEGYMRQAASAGPQPAGQNAIDIPENPPPGRDFSQPPAEDATDISTFPARGQRDPVVPVEDAGVSDNLAASATEIGGVAGDAGLDAKPRRRRKSQGGEKADGTPAAGDEVAPVEGASGVEDTIAAIQSEADEVFQSELARTGSLKKANAARKAYVDREKAARVRKTTGSSGTESAPATTPEAAPTSAADAAPAGAADEITPVTGDSGTGSTPKSDADVTDATPPKDRVADTTGRQDGGKPPEPKKRRLWPYVVGAGVGLGWLARQGGSGGGSNIDIPLPPGGGTGGGGDFVPLPAGNSEDAAALMQALDREVAMQRALDRIRGSRPDGGRPSYQTLGNYN